MSFRQITSHVKPYVSLGSIFVLLTMAALLLSSHYTFAQVAFQNPSQHGGFDGVPTNLRVKATYNTATIRKIENTLSWDAVPNAVSYNIYQNDTKIGSATSPSFLVGADKFNKNMTYAVTSVNSTGMESIPSNIMNATEAYDAANPPTWTDSTPLPPPDSLITMPDWNLGKPRIVLTWQHSDAPLFDIYRDGQRVAEGLWGLKYIDQNVQPGETHTYEVTSVKTYWPTQPEGAKSASVTGTALSAAPAFSSTKVNVTGVQANDDSVTIYFDEVPGAVDYRVYKVATPWNAKYAGWFGTGNLDGLAISPGTKRSIEMNGINITNGDDMVVEAVDKLGPFQKMDGFMGPGMMYSMATNGQGDPANIPNAIARSNTFHVAVKPRALAGAQVFYDKFNVSEAWQNVPISDPVLAQKYSGIYANMKEHQNSKWILRQYATDPISTQIFTSALHFMDTIYDGPDVTAPFSHNNNSSLVMLPKATADISGGKVLHVTMEVDGHFDGRRWTDIAIGGAGDSLLRADPTKVAETEVPTTSGNLLVWEMFGNSHALDLITPTKDANGAITGHQTTDLMQPTDWNDQQTYARSGRWGPQPQPNGTGQDIDKRSRFDLYLSKTHYKIVETYPDNVHQIVREKDFPAGASFPFDKVQVYYIHELYHTGNERPELARYAPSEAFWYNNRPWADERHWDNMGYEVLDNFSLANAVKLPTDSVVFTSPTPAPSNLSVTKTVDKSSAQVGDHLTYTITVQNNTGAQVANTKVQDPLPVGTSFISASDNGGISNGVVAWDVGTLAPGAMVTRTLMVQVQ